MTAILIRLAPYLLAAAAVFSGGWYAGGLQPKAALARLQAADWQAKALGEAQARKVVQAQLEQSERVSQVNAQAVEKLNADNAQIAADRDRNVELARRLLISANRPAAPGHPVPQAADHTGPVTAGHPETPPDVAGLLVNAAAGYEHCVTQLNALISEIKPQL